MPSSRRRLGLIEGKSQPQILYKAPDDATVLDTVISVLFVINVTPSTSSTYKVWHEPADSGLSVFDKNLIVPTLSLGGTASVRLMQGFCISPGETIWVAATLPNTINFHLHGQENRL
jgi:hypothetical protein